MALSWPFKAPDEVLDYSFDWAKRLGDDTIVTSNWTAPSGITKDSESHDATVTTVWLSGGTLGETYSFTNQIVTDAARTMNQTVTLKLRAK